MEILLLQLRQRPRRKSQLNKGNKSNHLSRVPHEVQWDGGNTMDSALGIRYMQTLKKLPSIIPAVNITIDRKIVMAFREPLHLFLPQAYLLQAVHLLLTTLME